MIIERVNREGYLDEAAIREVVREACATMPVTDRRVLFIIPDSTRSMPMPVMFSALHECLAERVAKMDYLIALGTHPAMGDEAINTLLGISPEDRRGRYGDVDIFNHDWQNPEALKNIGRLEEDEVASLSEGRLREGVDVMVNRRLFDYDLVCIVGPVFPHEVVGFSGGNKYFFPGVAGEEILNLFHWLGALMTNYHINGTKHTPVRAVVDRAASMIAVEKRCFCLNVVGKRTKAVFFGTPEAAWDVAADLSAHTHIVYKDRPFKSVLAMAPPMYDDIWVAGKCMYKLEPVVADGGELIIYAPHVSEVSVTHGKYIREVGYHTRDYFTAQMDRFAHIPRSILAHSTHVCGMGSYADGIEKPRVKVTLATAIPEAEARAINLGYLDHAGINLQDWTNREDEGYLLVENAGEVLYHLRDHTA